MDKRRHASEEEIVPAPLTGTKKLAILSLPKTNVYAFALYVVNVDMDSIYDGSSSASKYVKIRPRIGYSGDDKWVGCVSNSTLYIFLECSNMLDYVDEYGIPVFRGPPPRKTVKKFDLSPEFLDSDRVIQGTDEFKELAPMMWPKVKPIAVPTPDGKKILVFQQEFEPCCAKTCFELYDTSDNSWTEVDLPAAFTQTKCYVIYVSGYSMIDESSFVMFTDAGIVVLHLQSSSEKNKNKEKEVNKESLKFSKSKSLEGRFFASRAVTIDGVIAIGPAWASRLRIAGKKSRTFKVSSLPYGHGLLEPRPAITLLGVDKDKCCAHTLVSQTHRYGNGSYIGRSYLTIDVCRTELATLKTIVVGSLKYVIYSGNFIMDLSMYFI